MENISVQIPSPAAVALELTSALVISGKFNFKGETNEQRTAEVIQHFQWAVSQIRLTTKTST